MIDVAVSGVIDQPISSVFDFVSNFENFPKWESSFLEVTRLTDQATGVGTTYACVLKMLGQQIKSTFKVTEYDPNQKIAFEADQPVLAKPKGSFVFETAGQGTQITLLPRPEFGGLFKLLESLMAWYVQRNSEANLRRLKRLLEA